MHLTGVMGEKRGSGRAEDVGVSRRRHKSKCSVEYMCICVF